MEIIKNDELILQSTSRSHRFSCYEVDENGTTVLLPTGLPKKVYVVFKQKQYRTKDTVKRRSILAYVDYHTKEIKKDGVTKNICNLPFKIFSEAELLKLQEPEAIAMKDKDGNDVKVSMEELKKSYLDAKAKIPPKEKGEVPIHGTRTSKVTIKEN